MIGHKRIPSREGGVEIVVEELAERMIKLGHQVDVYNRQGHHISGSENDAVRTKWYKGARIITIPTFQNKLLNALVYSFLATARAIFCSYDVIHFHASGPCAMIWLPKLFKIRTVATLHGIDSKRAKWGGVASKYLKFGEKMAVNASDHLIVLSESNKKYIYDTYGRNANFIPNGVNPPVIRTADIIKNLYSLDKDEYILYLGRIVPEKGIHYLINAYKKITTDKKLVVAGGTSHTDSYVREVKELAKEDSRIIFTGFVQGTVLEELFSNAYVYVLPSDIEGMPISLLEAMSFGNCCLVSDISENSEVVEDKALTFSSGDAESLKERLQQLISDSAITEAYKKNAADFILRKYRWDNVVEKTLKLYENSV